MSDFFNNPRDPFGPDFDKRFNKAEARFDKQFDRMDNMMDHPVRSFVGLGLLAIVLNLLFWGGLIVTAVWAVSHFLL